MTRVRRRRWLQWAGLGALGEIAAGGGAARATTTATGATAASPACAGTRGQVDIISNSFPAMQHMARMAERCNGPGLRVNVKLTTQVQPEVETAFASAGASAFDAAVVSMGVFSNLYSRRQLHPLTELVNRHGRALGLEERMLVRVDGEVMAIACMQNAQNLYYRRDLFERHRLAVPTTYDEMKRAAEVLRAREPGLTYPIAQSFSKGWDLATEFTNLHASLGGRFFRPGSAEPAFQEQAGQQTVALMKSLLPYMTPNALAANSDDVMNQLQQGRAAMGVLWASRAARMDDSAASRVVGLMEFAAAPAARAGGGSAAHLWWDGVVMPRNGRPARREAAFRVLMQMLGEGAVAEGNDLAIWVRSNYRPGRFGVGVAQALAGGAPVWPGEPFFSLAHGQLGKVLPEALVGTRSAADVLTHAAREYRLAAIEKGFIAERAAAIQAAPAGRTS